MSWRQIDEQILLNFNALVGRNDGLDAVVEATAVYSIYAVPIALIWLWFSKVREAGIRAALSGLLCWLVFSPIIGKIWFRPRPPLAELGGREVLFHRPTYSFPSDHAAFLIAVAVTLYVNGYRKIAIALFVLTGLVSLARIAFGFHYPSDIAGGWLMGLTVAWLVHRNRAVIDRLVSRPLIRLAAKVGLA